MYKQLNYLTLALAATAAVSLSSCDDDDNNNVETQNSATKAIIEQYVNNTVVPTYKLLADESIELHNACVALKTAATQENVAAACAEWISARKYWEESEAFLYGAASDYNIDPHIDSWPLDKSLLDITLANNTLIKNMDSEGCNFAGFSTLGYGLLGFHAIEYVLFRNGEARDVNDISSKELIYAAAVAEDMRNQCIRLEASWTGIDNVTANKQTILEDAELEPSLNYGQTMVDAGEVGNSLYKTQKDAIVQILTGCSEIADEVGNTKITDPVNSGNVLDVESWYSWNSIVDFADNIRSIQHAYLGGRDDIRDLKKSPSAFLAEIDEETDEAVKAAITNAIKEIEAMPAPFRNNLTTAATAKAVDACNALVNTLDKAIESIEEQ